MNVGFHATNTLLLLLFLYQTTGAIWRSALVAALFALHPLHVESVAWVSERKDVLSAFFGLLTLIAYAAYAKSRVEGRTARAKYAAALALFALGLMSKPMLVSWPVVMLLMDFWPLNRVIGDNWEAARKTWIKLACEKAPFLLLTVLSCVITFMVQQHGAVSSAVNLPIEDRLANAIVSYLKYIGKTFWPENLAVFYPHPELRYPTSNQWPAWGVLVAAASIITISLHALRYRRQHPYEITGWFWFIITLIPTIGIVQVGTQAMADRYTYIPHIGLFIAIVWMLAGVATRWHVPKSVLFGSVILIIGILAILTEQQVRTWQNDTTLFSHTLKAVPNNHVAHSLLGKTLAKQGQADEAISHFRAALTAYPGHADAHFDIGMIHYQNGNLEAAIEEFRAQIASRPSHLPSYQGLGAAYWKSRQDLLAEEAFRSALQLNPDYPDANVGLGTVLLEKGDFEEAKEYLLRALQQKPTLLQAQESLAQILAIQGQFEESSNILNKCVSQDSRPEIQAWLGFTLEASGNTNQAQAWLQAAKIRTPDLAARFLTQGQEALKMNQPRAAATYFEIATLLNPEFVEVHDHLAAAKSVTGDLAAAIKHFAIAARQQPTPERYYNLALASILAGEINKGIANLDAALALKPDWPVALNELGWILATCPQADVRNGSRAIELAERACKIQPNEPRFWGTLDAAYAEAGRFSDAIRTAEKAQQMATEAGQNEIATAAEQRLVKYRQRLPFHQ